MKYWDEKFYWTYQRGVGWPKDYIGSDSMAHWILAKSVGFTDIGLYRISESVRAYAYLILSSQASARSSIVGNTACTLTAQSAFLNNFENVANRRVNIQEDIKHYQDTLSYASSKVDYSMGENIYMLPSNMNLKIRLGTVGYNNKILASDEKFSLGKNKKVNAGFSKPEEETTKKDSKVVQKLTTIHKVVTQKPIIVHKEERAALILFLTGGFTIGLCFDKQRTVVLKIWYNFTLYGSCFDKQRTAVLIGFTHLLVLASATCS